MTQPNIQEIALIDVNAIANTLNQFLEPQSIIAANIQSLPSLDILLEQINSDFAVALAAQCNKIAQLDSVTTSAEAQVLETIINKFAIDLKAFQQMSLR